MKYIDKATYLILKYLLKYLVKAKDLQKGF